MVNTRKLKALLVKQGYTQKEIATQLKLSTTAFFNKLHNKSEFTANEIGDLSMILYIKDKDEIFFAQNVE